MIIHIPQTLMNASLSSLDVQLAKRVRIPLEHTNAYHLTDMKLVRRCLPLAIVQPGKALDSRLQRIQLLPVPTLTWQAHITHMKRAQQTVSGLLPGSGKLFPRA